MAVRPIRAILKNSQEGNLMPDTIKHASFENLSVFARELKARFARKADVYSKAEVDGKVSSVYKPAGSVAFAELPPADEAHLGMVYNVTDKFTTTDSFIEGAGKKHPAGTNVAIVKSGEAYKYDALSGFVDLSGYVEREDGKGLSESDYTAGEKAKLAGIAEGAAKVEASANNGSINVNGEEVTVYTLPDTVVHTGDIEAITEAEIVALFEDNGEG